MTDNVGPGSQWHAVRDVPLITESIGDVLRRRALEQGDGIALRWPAQDESIEAMSFAELWQVSEQIAGSLLAMASPGDAVAVWSRNSLEWVHLFYGCALAGMVVAPFNPAWTQPELISALGVSNPKIIFTGQDGRGEPLGPRAEAVVGGSIPVMALDAISSLPEGMSELPSVDVDAPFLIQFTSGTTGRSKGALLSQRSALNSGYIRSLNGHADADDVWLNPVPLHHIGGTCFLVLGSLSVGGSYVVMEKFDPDLLVRLIDTTHASRLGGVPTMVAAILDRASRPLGGQIRGMALGGASVPPALVRRVRDELGVVASIGYGQSECPIVTNTGDSDDIDTLTNTVGRPAPHSDVKIVDPATSVIVELGTIGELCVRSPIVMEEYVNAEAATAEVLEPDGFLHTGDLASMDARGVISIHGRAREVIIRGGENVYPREVENAVEDSPSVAQAAVVGLPDEHFGQIVAAAVRLEPGEAQTGEELETFLVERIAHFKIPRRWIFLDEFPLTASGKIRKIDLTDRF